MRIALLAALCAACDGNPHAAEGDEPIESLPVTMRLRPESPVVIAGAPFQLFAHAPGIGAQSHVWAPGQPRWISSDTTIARVDSAGRLIGIRAGRVTITATSGGERTQGVVATVEEPVELERISAGEVHTCALSRGGRAVCWGDADYAELGAETAPAHCNQYGCKRTPARAPLPVGTTSSFVSIAVGGYARYWPHSCGLASTGTVLCWGNGEKWQLGGPYRSESYSCTAGSSYSAPCSYAPLPVPVSGAVQAVASGGSFSCALSTTGDVTCWGSNDRGKAGQAAARELTLPARVPTERRFVAITAGESHACALDADGAAFCWGDNRKGQLGIGPPDTAARPIPVAAAGERRFSALDAGVNGTCGIVSPAGEAHCWGDDSDGVVSGAAASAAQGLAFSAISLGRAHACGIASGEAYCWGSNSNGQLGTSATVGSAPVRSPLPVAGGHRWREVSAGYEHSCAITREGVAYCWGLNDDGQAGVGSDERIVAAPTRVAGQR